MTIAEKILARASGEKDVSSGDYVVAKVDAALVHENAARIHRKCLQGGLKDGLPMVWDPERVIVVFDHYVPPTSIATASDHKLIRELVKRYHIKHFYDVNVGICHQVMVEKGHVRPGMLIVGADSHTTTYGAFNAISTGISYTEMAYVLLTGKLYFRVPETIRFEITGELPDWVMSKDVMLYMAGKYGLDTALYKSVEFAGPTVKEMSMSSRMTMSNMVVELGGKFGVFEEDHRLINYLKARTDKPFTPVKSDPDAMYGKEYAVDVTDLEPQIACPHSVDNVRSVSELKEIKVDQAFLGSCTNGRLEDLEMAAKILQGRRVHSDTRLLVSPASWEVYKNALSAGIIETLLNSGAVICNPSCGPCFGGQYGILAPSERCISSTNRNFKGRMGSPEAEVYLASPATVAASAIAGAIADPRETGGD